MKNFIKGIVVTFVFVIINLTFGCASVSPNSPIVVGGLTPIKYKNGNWVSTNPILNDWYNYNKNNWAHAQLTTTDGEEIKYVWIPRFTYKIESGNVSIKWSDGTEDGIIPEIGTTLDGYHSHPAFTFDNKEVTGFWIEKSSRTMNNDIVTEFSKAASDHNFYGLADSAACTHVTKASEWGAIVYLDKAGKSIKSNITIEGNEYVMGVNSKGVDTSFSSTEKKIFIDLLDIDKLDSYKGYALTEFGENGNSEGKYLVRNGLKNWWFDFGNGGNYRTSIYILFNESGESISFFDTEATVEEGSELLIGVDFNIDVGEDKWKFPGYAIKDGDLNFFEKIKKSEDSEEYNDKVIDLELIGTGRINYKQSELNAQIVALVTPDLEKIEKEDIIRKNIDGFESGKYTLILNIGGTKNGNSIFKKIADDEDTKIVVNEINLCKQDDSYIKIGNVSRNKITLNIVGIIDTNYKIVMTKAPTEQRNYIVGEALNYNGADFKIIRNGIEIGVTGIPDGLTYDGENPTGEARENVEVRLKVYDKVVEKTEGEEFIINVYDGITVNAVGEKKDTDERLYTISNSRSYIKKIGNKINLEAKEFHNGYMFYSWNKSESNATIENVSNREYELEISDDLENEINLVADYVSPEITGNNLRTEFLVGVLVGELFDFGDFTAKYTKLNGTIKSETIDKTELSTKIVNKENGVVISKSEGLKKGIYTVTIQYGGSSYSYDIAVVNQKSDLAITINEISCGSVSGNINSKAVSLTTVDNLKQEVSFNDVVNLTATPKDGFSFIGWSIKEDSNLVLSEGKLIEAKGDMPLYLSTSPNLSFNMVDKSIEITANFGVTITFEIRDGQNNLGQLVGELTQNVVHGRSTSKVEANARSEYVLVNWINKENNKIISEDKELTVNPVIKSETYVATFAKRINIVEDYSDSNMIKAHITGTKIKSGTLQYIVTPSPEVPNESYSLSEILGMANGSWVKDDTLGIFKSASVEKGYDSSTVITVNTSNKKERVKFDYIIDSSYNSQLGITINGETVIGPYKDITYGEWQNFSKNIEAVDGKIEIGISYSQGNINGGNNYAAIKNLTIEKLWTAIPNDYNLTVPMEFDTNYIHVKGTGSDDDELYRAVSNVFGMTTGQTYTVTYDANGGSGAPASQTKTAGVNLTLSSTVPTYSGHTFAGWNTAANGSGTSYAAGATYSIDATVTLYAQWTENTPTYYTVRVQTYIADGYLYTGGMFYDEEDEYSSGETASISPGSVTGYSFDHWEVISGSAPGIDTTSKRTSFTVVGNVTVRAIMTAD